MTDSRIHGTQPGGAATLHMLDTTMFWTATGGGVRRYLLRKRAWLRQHSHWRHTIVAPRAHGAGMADCGGLPLPLTGGYCLPLRRTRAAELIVDLAPDVIEAGDPYRLAWASIDAARALGVPVLAFCHSNLAALAMRLSGQDGMTASLARRTAEAYLRRVYQHFDLVLAPSESMVGTLRDLGIQRVERQALGVDSDIFHPARRSPGLRAELGLPSDARLLLYAGRFAPEKNLPALAEAVRRLGAPYYLLAVGHGPVQPQGHRVIQLPHEWRATELARLYASVDGFVHNGDQETFGLSALEAMACGTPVAVRATAGLRELVDNGAGIAVESGDPGVWAEAIVELFGAARESRIAAARQLAESLDWRHIMPGMLARYQSLAMASRPRAAA